MVLHESGEDYLEAILVLRQQKGNVRSIDVAQHLGFSKPSVSRAVSILKSNGYLNMEKDGRLELTPQGEAAFPRLPKAPPYEGAKDYLLAEDVDDREGLTRLVQVTCEALRAQSVRKRRK